jgi:putative ABC transport system permease protein
MSVRHNKPPRFATRMLRVFLRDDLVAEVTADLQEQYDDKLQSSTKIKAKLDYWYQVINYARPFAIRRNRKQFSTPYPMYKSYFRTAIRNMHRDKLHAFINIAGLSVGIAVTLMIGLWIWDELSFDKQFDNYSRVGQVIQNVTNNGEVQTWNNVPYPLADELRKNYGADFKHVALTTGISGSLITAGGKNIVKRGCFAEQNFIAIFPVPLVKGTYPTPKEPSSVLVSESMAKAFFGDRDPIGESMVIDEQMNVKIAGVFRDQPHNSTFNDLDFIGSWEFFVSNSEWVTNMDMPWRPNAFLLYVELLPKADFAQASARIKDAKLKKVNETLAKKKPELFILPMKDWHLDSEFRDGKKATGRIQYVWIFGLVGAFVLLMACINFMNLSTARSEKRAKEVGIRKAVGSLRSQLIGQFFCESILTAFFAFIIAFIIVQLCLPAFNQLADKRITLIWFDPVWIAGGAALSILIGLVAGSYPALYLSSIKSISALKGAFKAGTGSTLPRKVMVTVQFTISIILIIGTSVVFLQIMHAKNRPLGYDTDGLISVQYSSEDFHKHFESIQTSLKNEGAIISMAEATTPATEAYASSSGFDWAGKDPDLSVDFGFYGVSYDYGKTIGWNIAEGRDFSHDFLSDSAAVILNEAAVQYMGLKHPVGEIIRWHGTPYTVVGVVKNIVIRSPYDEIAPNLYFMFSDRQNFLIARLNPEIPAATALEKIEAVYKKYELKLPFNYEFTDVGYARKFNDEERIGSLASLFASLAIFVSCLGIFGLSSFIAERRTKEIGIRKVMGASVFNLWGMMSRDFVVLVLFSSVIALPIAYTLLKTWLEKYSYRIDFPVWTLAVASLGTIVITLLTISWHTVHAAKLNPVKSLRTE